MIPDTFINDLLRRLDIVDVIDKRTPLKKAGQNYQACCPFHKEKSPSFSVSPAKQFYHCFGCGAHGSAIGFVMEFDGLSFPDAVEKLAGTVGMQVPVDRAADAGKAMTGRKQAGGALEVLATAARFYAGRLKATPRAVDYLKGRGLTGEVAAAFCLGYAPDEWQALAPAFAQYANDSALSDAGMVIDSEQGRRYDRFRDRIMFPIHNDRGEVIGFGGRVLDKGEPKYLNSPETALFSKGRELYGLHQAKAAIRESGVVVVVEGYMDVVALAQYGVRNAVATLGTACTPDHVRKLLRLADRVVFCFDGDAAGQRAAWRALENALPLVQDGKAVEFLFLPIEHDPDSYVRRHGAAGFAALLDRDTFPLSAYLFQTLAGDLASTEGRAAFVKAAGALVSQVQAPVLRTLLVRRMAELADLPESDVARLLPAPASRDARPERPGTLARQLLQLAVFCPSLTANMPVVYTGEGSPDPATAALQRVADIVADMPAAPDSPQLIEAMLQDAHFPAVRAAFFSAVEANARSKSADIRRRWGELFPALLAEGAR
ncbi:DNA primase [Chitinimonas sp.]|uniref:DNA primase n=1 Tax=Chitinimonas sp. TaxID=1934313 RepID=UPI0035AF1560